jgi:hypothetical protein
MSRVACNAFDRNGLWLRQRLTQVVNYATSTDQGWFVGGHRLLTLLLISTRLFLPPRLRGLHQVRAMTGSRTTQPCRLASVIPQPRYV